MKQRSNKNPVLSTAPAVQGRISLRLDPPINSRFEAIVKASRRSKTSLIEECIERLLPDFEKRYEPELKAA